MKIYEWEDHFENLDLDKHKAVADALNQLIEADKLIATEFKGLDELRIIANYTLESKIKALRSP